MIGVNTAIYTPTGGNVGIGFAIPAETVGSVIAELRNHGRVDRGWLGVQIQPVTAEIAESLGMEKATGILIADVLPSSPAQAAGLKAGDLILSAGGETMDNYKALPMKVADMDAGQTLSLEIARGGDTRTVSVEVGPMPGQEVAARVPAEAADPDQPRIGLYLVPLTPEIRQRQGFDDQTRGVLIADVQEGSPAERAGIKAGSLISMVGQEEVSTPGQVVERVRSAARQQRSSVLLLVQQDGKQMFVTVPFGKVS